MIYSLPYVFIILILGVIAIYSQSMNSGSTERSLSVICLVMLLFFFGLRGFIGDDWQSYYSVFQTCSLADVTFNIFDGGDSSRYEPGFTLLMWLCKSIFNNYFFFQFICSAINLSLLFLFLKRRVSNMPFGMLLFVCFGGFGLMTNMIRNSIAILIFINSIEFIEKRQPVPYFALCLLAISFHMSALLYVPLYFFIHLKCNKWVFLGVFILGNVFFLGHFQIFIPMASLILGDSSGRLQNMVDVYTSGNLAVSTGISIGYLERLLTGALIFCYYGKLNEIRKENKVFINAFIAYFMLFFFLSEFKEMSQRLSSLFFFSYWILWGDLLKCFYYKNNKKLFMAFIAIYCVTKIIGQTDMITSKYDNVVFGCKSYQERLYIYNKYTSANQ